jgi:hypothetical protein
MSSYKPDENQNQHNRNMDSPQFRSTMTAPTFNHLQQKDIASSRITDRRIEFHLASKPVNGFQTANGAVGTAQSSGSTNERLKPLGQMKSSIQSKQEVGLFDSCLVSKYANWHKISRIGPGFFNLGNTCKLCIILRPQTTLIHPFSITGFLNSTLQCLLYIPPLTQLLVNHSKTVLQSHSSLSAHSGSRPGLMILNMFAR